MTERQRLVIKKFRDEEEAREQAERELAERPIREATKKFNANMQKLAGVLKERLLGKVIDPNRIAVDPAVATIRMTKQQAREFNRREFDKYRDAHPDVYWNLELLGKLDDYFARNGLGIVTGSMIGSLRSL